MIDALALSRAVEIGSLVFLLLVLLRGWIRKHNNPKAVLIIFLSLSVILLSLKYLSIPAPSHSKLGLLGPAAAFTAIAALYDKKVNKWSVTAYSLIVLVVLLIPYVWVLSVISVLLALGSIALAGWAYHNTKNKGLVFFILGILVFTGLGITARLGLLPHQTNMLGLTAGVILWSIPFLKRV